MKRRLNWKRKAERSLKFVCCWVAATSIPSSQFLFFFFNPPRFFNQTEFNHFVEVNWIEVWIEGGWRKRRNGAGMDLVWFNYFMFLLLASFFLTAAPNLNDAEFRFLQQQISFIHFLLNLTSAALFLKLPSSIHLL